MPFIHVRSLPLASDIDLTEAVSAISREFAAAADTDLAHVTVTWELIEPGHYGHAGQTAPTQPAGSHPVLVELVAPDLNSPERVELMLRTSAAAVARQAGVGAENVFVEHRPARPGQVFDQGEVVRW
jgi:phenylpyruvate tautomerase PptA (4-oxalocrotonate tautomerase family)